MLNPCLHHENAGVDFENGICYGETGIYYFQLTNHKW